MRLALELRQPAFLTRCPGRAVKRRVALQQCGRDADQGRGAPGGRRRAAAAGRAGCRCRTSLSVSEHSRSAASPSSQEAPPWQPRLSSEVSLLWLLLGAAWACSRRAHQPPFPAQAQPWTCVSGHWRLRQRDYHLLHAARVGRCGALLSAAALLLVELEHLGLHAKPLQPLLPARARVADRRFLRRYTTAAFFASELALLALLAAASPVRRAAGPLISGAAGPTLTRRSAAEHLASRCSTGAAELLSCHSCCCGVGAAPECGCSS